MPILNIKLARDAYSPSQLETLLVQASELYARVLESPIERVRVFIDLLDPGAMAVGGRVVSRGAARAPFFEVMVLAGRPPEQKLRLMEELTGLLETVLGVERKHIRGLCRSVDPDDWCIAGSPASVQRAGEIRARREAG